MAEQIAEDGPSGPGSLRRALRDGTSADHRNLDQAFARLDLTQRDDYARYLAAHAIGLGAVWPTVARFAAAKLGHVPTDLQGLLAADLAALGIEPRELPRMATGPLDPIGACYVIAGSRLGIAVQAGEPYWHGEVARADRYLTDRGGLGLWRALVAWLGTLPADPVRDAAAVCGGRATFALFGEALELAGQVTTGVAA